MNRHTKNSLTILKSLHAIKIEVCGKDTVNPLKGEAQSNNIVCLDPAAKKTHNLPV